MFPSSAEEYNWKDASFRSSPSDMYPHEVLSVCVCVCVCVWLTFFLRVKRIQSSLFEGQGTPTKGTQQHPVKQWRTVSPHVV